ncbi:TPA: hypothetical protein ACGTKE_003939 [Escherichia coli]
MQKREPVIIAPDYSLSLNFRRPCASGCGNPRNGAAVSMAGLFLPR